MTDYAVVDLKTLEVTKAYSGYVSLPDPVVWPNGDATHATPLGEERAGCRFVEVVYAGDAPGEFYHVTDYVPSLEKSHLTFSRQWAPDDLEATKTIALKRLNDQTEAKILNQVSLAEIVASLAKLAPAEAWSAAVINLDASRKQAASATEAALTVDDVALAIADVSAVAVEAVVKP